LLLLLLLLVNVLLVLVLLKVGWGGHPSLTAAASQLP
jgi:hypothetical protein